MHAPSEIGPRGDRGVGSREVDLFDRRQQQWMLATLLSLSVRATPSPKDAQRSKMPWIRVTFNIVTSAPSSVPGSVPASPDVSVRPKRKGGIKRRLGC